MAKPISQIRPSSWSPRENPKFLLFTVASVVSVALSGLWFWSEPRPTYNYRVRTTANVSDGVLSHDCSHDSPFADANLGSDPGNATFYDDPTLSYSIADKPISNWDEKRREWFRLHPSFAAGRRERVLLLTGSQPTACGNPRGDHFLLRLFKNKVDYCRIHGYDVFYSNTFFHPKMRSYWAKLPLIRAAMVAHPESEWIYWVDSDAVFTDMEFRLPLRRYKGYNLVVHGWPELIYGKRSWVGLNAGVFMIRNCQWSIDFIHVWASMGPQSPDFVKWGQAQKSLLPDKTFQASDDQSALVYLLLKEPEKWADKIYIEGQYYFQGYWLDIVGTLDNVTKSYARIERRVRRLRRRRGEVETECYATQREEYLESAGYGLNSWRRPFITHFTGCQPCSGSHNPAYEVGACSAGLEKALNFANNQVLRRYGFAHSDMTNLSHVSALPFDSPRKKAS